MFPVKFNGSYTIVFSDHLTKVILYIANIIKTKYLDFTTL